MLKIVHLLMKNRSIVLVFLAAPLISVLLSSRFQFNTIPESPFTGFVVEFNVPSRSAQEIVDRVVEPAEKVFNGLPGLVSLESETEPSRGRVFIRFKESVNPDTAYLYIQEKMDRIRLILPNDVESTRVDRQLVEKRADLELNFERAVSPSILQDVFGSISSAITRTEPETKNNYFVEVIPSPLKMATEKVSLSQVVNALKSVGLSTSIGRQGGVMFETGLGFQTIEDVRGAVVASREHRSIRVIDVAEVKFELPAETNQIRIWLDTTRVSLLKAWWLLRKSDLNMSLSFPNIKSFINQSIHPIIGLMVVFILQIFLFQFIFGHKIRLRSLVFFDGLLTVHFLFWKGVIAGDLSVLDLHSLVLTAIVGTLLWVVLVSRIRTYFLSDDLIEKPPKSVEQATLFGIAELMPTFSIIAIAIWLVSLPVLSTAVNLPSREVLVSFFYVGIPILFFILLLMPIIGDTDWVDKRLRLPKLQLNWKAERNLQTLGLWAVPAAVAGALVIFLKLGVGVSQGLDQNDFSQVQMAKYRGYSRQLEYVNFEDAKAIEKMEVVRSGQILPTKIWEVSAGGMQFLGHLDIKGFAKAMSEVETMKSFGFLSMDSNKIPLRFRGAVGLAEELGDLLLAPKQKEDPPIPIRLITSTFLQSMPVRVMRDTLAPSDRFAVKEEVSRGDLKSKASPGFLPTAWSQFILDQVKSFSEFHLISLVFLFILFSLNFNSFIRGGIFFLFTLSMSIVPLGMSFFVPGPYHADSLWMLHLAPLMCGFVILVLARVIDIERARGNDRDQCVEEVRRNFAPSVFISTVFAVFCFVVMAVLEWMPWFPSLGIWKESLVVGLATAMLLVLTAQFFFPLFYLSSEEFVDGILMRLYKWLAIRRRLKKH